MTLNSLTWNSDLYDNKHDFVSQYGHDLIQILNPAKNERILDLGCGTGQLASEISELAGEVVGMDYSTDMIQTARENYPHIDFRVMDAADFSFPEPFDAIFSNAALHWVKDYNGAARSMYDNLKPGGRLVLEMGGQGNVATIAHTLQQVMAEHGYTPQSTYFPWYFPTIGEYASVLEAAGFRVIYAHHYDRPTELKDSDAGIIDWLEMFAEGFFADVSLNARIDFMHEVQEQVRPTLFRDGKWYADYKRLRVVAAKGGG